MNMNIGEVITLSNGIDYVITHRKVINGKTYGFLLEMPSYKTFKFVEFINDTDLEEVVDEELIEQLVVEFAEAGK